MISPHCVARVLCTVTHAISIGHACTSIWLASYVVA